MGSNRIEANTGEFSARINGLVTQKPCGASKQIASLDSAEPRRNSQSVFQLDPAWRVRASEFLPDEELIPSIATLAEEMTLTERMTGIPVVPCAVPVAKAPDRSLEESGLNNEYFPKSEEAAALKRGRVLLLESDPFCRAIVADCLAENGYMVVAVCDPEEALGEMASSEKVRASWRARGLDRAARFRWEVAAAAVVESYHAAAGRTALEPGHVNC